MATIFDVPGLGTFSIETTKGVTVISESEDGEPWLTCAAFPHEHGAALVAIVAAERERHYNRGVKAGKLLVEGQINFAVGLVAKAWFTHHPNNR